MIAPWVALAPLFLLLPQRRATRLGLLHGVAFWLVGISWIAPTVSQFGGLPGWVGVGLLLALAAYLGSYHAAFAWVGARLWRSGDLVAILGVAALWTALEGLRGWLLGGFPWNLAAYSWIEVPGALPLSSWIGPFGLTFVVVSVNAAVARAVERRRVGGALWAVGAALVLLSWAARWAGPTPELGLASSEARLVQPNTPIRSGDDAEEIARDYARLLEQSREACDVPGALLVWPESAAWPYSWDRTPRLRGDVAALAAAGCPVLFNTTMREEGGYFNAVLLVDAGGVAGRYDKRHLVPFGEEVPSWAAWIPGVPALARAVGRFEAGSGVELLPWGAERLGVSICFEITFPGEVAEAVAEGATTLVTVTNDAWYGDTWAPWQHFRAARFRAAENRRPLLRAATTGVTGWVDPSGRAEELLGVNELGVIDVKVSGRTDRTLYSRAPWLATAASWLLTAFAILRARRRP